LLLSSVKGVSEGWEKKLEIQGVGFRAVSKGNNIELSLGFSHPVLVEPPEDIKLTINKNIIIVDGINKQKVGNFAAKIRDLKKPEPYKGKGIRYEGEDVRRKAGKAAKAIGAGE